MEQPELEKGCAGSEDGSLSRNRSFKSNKLVRSQAIRESTSPPRTVSPYMDKEHSDKHTEPVAVTDRTDRTDRNDRTDSDVSSHSDRCGVGTGDRMCDAKRKPVEIQITTNSGSCAGAWVSGSSDQRLRARRWLGPRPQSEPARELLGGGARVACVCGACACPHCRGRRRKHSCPSKQDSGIVCSDDCPDCSDTEHAGPNGDGARKSGSFDGDDQTFYCRCPERKEKPKSLPLSGTDLEDKTEPTGPELVNFIKETLNKNPRDRMTLLKIEKELHALVNDNGRCIVRFPVMTSYGRMLVHRCATLFQLAHHLDHSNKSSVLVSKSGTSGGRIPCTSFRQWCTATFPRSPPRRHDDTLAKSILKRAGANGAGSLAAAGAGRSKSLEQREREYERARRRIFSTDNCSQDETQWPWLTSGPVKLLTPEGGQRNKLLKVQSLESRGGPESGAVVRGVVSKSHSFGGYTDPPPQHRLLSRQGDLASSSWRLSPSSSGYKTLSLRSTDSVTPSPTGGASPEPGIEGALVWAVTDMSAVPPGAVVIHPQTGRPLTNPDGSVYHFDPNNPPVLYDASGYIQDNKNDASNEKRRGKLEKQHSFIDNECECPPTEESRSKCCCECRRHDVCQKTASVKNSPQKTKPASNPVSPVKIRYEDRSTKPNSPEPNQAQKPEPKETKQHEDQYEPPRQNEPSPKTDKPPNQRSFETQTKYESPIVEKAVEQILPNHRLEVQNSSNQSPSNSRFDSSAYQRPAYEAGRFESANQKALESQRSFEARQNDQAQRMKTGQEDMYQQNYVQGFRNDEIVSPQAVVSYQPPEMDVQSMIQKSTPVPMPDPNIRPMSLTNVMYPVPQHNAYHYVSPCRIEQPLQPPMYQQLVHQSDEQKQLTASPHNDTTFRIDPSYPYAADLSACGACDPNTMQPRGYNVGYGQVEVPPGVVPYPVPNVLIQPQLQPYPYQEQMPIQWQGVQQVPVASAAVPKVMLHDLYPVVYPNVYQPYNIVYPQVIPQPYPIVQQVYPLVDKPERRNSIPRPKRNSQTPSDDSRYDQNRDERQSEIAMKIQQIKEQMAQLNTRDNKGVGVGGGVGGRNNEWRRRNSGSGILGSYPVNFNGRVVGRPPNEEVQLSSAARAIVNSIRNMQAKNNYQHDARRFDRPDRPDRPDRQDRHDARPRRDDRPDRVCRAPCFIRQMSPGTWVRRSPGPLPPAFNQPRRPHPDSRNGRR